MLFIKIIGCLLLLILLLYVIFLLRGGNFHLIPRNLTRTYKSLKRILPVDVEVAELLFCTVYINGITYHRGVDRILLYTFYQNSKECSKIKSDEVSRLLSFISLVMIKYLQIDNPSRSDASDVKFALNKFKNKMKSTIISEFQKSKGLEFNSSIVIDARTVFQDFEKAAKLSGEIT